SRYLSARRGVMDLDASGEQRAFRANGATGKHRGRKKAGADQDKLLPGELRPPKQVFRDVRNYLAGQFVGATRDDALLDEVLKCLFCKLYLETSAEEHPEPDRSDVASTAHFYRALFAKVRKDFPEIYKAGDEILLDPPSLVHV